MDIHARVDVNCGRKDGRTNGQTDGRTENRAPISHLAKAGATINVLAKTERFTPLKQEATYSYLKRNR